MRKIASVCLIAVISAPTWLSAATDPKALAEAAKARAAEASVNVPKSTAPADPVRVQKLADEARARGRAELERLVAERSAQEQGSRAATDPAPHTSRGEGAGRRVVTKGRVIVALSSSMPTEMVREYMRQAHGVGEVIIVLRGFVGGARAVGPTGVWLEEVMRKQPSCRECPHYLARVVVDPLVYRNLNITRVPAIAYVPEIEELQHCDGEALQSAGMVYGAVPISAALAQLARNGVAVPAALLKTLAGPRA